MTMCLSVKSNVATSTFEYSGESPELWIQSVKRVLRNPKFQIGFLKGRKPYCLVDLPESTDNVLSLSGVKSVKDRVRLPTFYIEVERVLALIAKGDWETLRTEFDRDYFKHGIRKIWVYAQEDNLLLLERKVYECLLQNGNGGLDLDSVIERLFKGGTVASFSQVRDALEHLAILYVVERFNGEFSPRFGILE